MRERTRKALALLLVVAMALSLVPAAYAAPEDDDIIAAVLHGAR